MEVGGEGEKKERKGATSVDALPRHATAGVFNIEFLGHAQQRAGLEKRKDLREAVGGNGNPKDTIVKTRWHCQRKPVAGCSSVRRHEVPRQRRVVAVAAARAKHIVADLRRNVQAAHSRNHRAHEPAAHG
jgi:hypothetical protein